MYLRVLFTRLLACGLNLLVRVRVACHHTREDVNLLQVCTVKITICLINDRIANYINILEGRAYKLDKHMPSGQHLAVLMMFVRICNLQYYPSHSILKLIIVIKQFSTHRAYIGPLYVDIYSTCTITSL